MGWDGMRCFTILLHKCFTMLHHASHSHLSYLPDLISQLRPQRLLWLMPRLKLTWSLVAETLPPITPHYHTSAKVRRLSLSLSLVAWQYHGNGSPSMRHSIASPFPTSSAALPTRPLTSAAAALLTFRSSRPLCLLNRRVALHPRLCTTNGWQPTYSLLEKHQSPRSVIASAPGQGDCIHRAAHGGSD